MATSGTATFNLDLNDAVEALDKQLWGVYHTQTEAQRVWHVRHHL
jgi:hypothetical protein